MSNWDIVWIEESSMEGYNILNPDGEVVSSKRYDKDMPIYDRGEILRQADERLNDILRRQQILEQEQRRYRNE